MGLAVTMLLGADASQTAASPTNEALQGHWQLSAGEADGKVLTDAQIALIDRWAKAGAPERFRGTFYDVPWEADSGYPLTVYLSDLAPETASSIVVNWGDGNTENGDVRENNTAHFRHAYASPYALRSRRPDTAQAYPNRQNRPSSRQEPDAPHSTASS